MDPWGRVADEQMMTVDPAEIPDADAAERLIVRCARGHALVHVHDGPSEFPDGSAAPVAVWNGPVSFLDVPETSRGYYVWHRRRHIGTIPYNFVSREVETQFSDADLDGIIAAQCHCGTHFVPVRNVAGWLHEKLRYVVLPRRSGATVR